MPDKFYIDTRDNPMYLGTLHETWKPANVFRKILIDYIESRGFEYKQDVDIHIISTPGIIVVRWIHSNCANKELFDEIKKFALEEGYKYTDNLTELLGED